MYYAVAASAAVAIAVMVAFNGELTSAYGEYLSTLMIHVVGLISVSLVSCAKRENPFKLARGVPFGLLLGGAINYFTIFFNTLSINALSVTAVLALSLLGQAATSLIIDCFGLFGMPKRRLGMLELGGLAVTAVGIAVLLDGMDAAGALPIILSILAGTCCVLTRQVTAQLSERTSSLTGTWFSYFTGTTASLIAMAVAAVLGVDVLPAVTVDARVWIYLGGTLGAVAVFLQAVSTKHMSSVSMTLVMFAGQVFGGAVIDALFYSKFSAETLIGGVLAFVGLVLNALASRRRSAVAG